MPQDCSPGASILRSSTETMPQRIPNSQSAVFASLLILAGLSLGSSTWAYINGREFHSTLRDFERSLRTKGFALSVYKLSTGVEGDLPENSGQTKEVAKDVKVDPADNEAFQTFVNQLVGQAVQKLPQPVAENLSIEDKREISRVARESIRDAVLKHQETIQKGELKSVRFQVGAVSYKSYCKETKEGGNRESRDRRIVDQHSGIVPFIAIQPITERDPAK